MPDASASAAPGTTDFASVLLNCEVIALAELVGSGRAAVEEGDRMGIGIEVSCPCFGSYTLPVGPRQRPPKMCWFLFLCQTCRCCSQLDIHAKRLRCTHCQGEDVVPYGHPDAIGQPGTKTIFQCWPCKRFAPELLTLTDGTYWCPTCEQFTASFRDCGIRWD